MSLPNASTGPPEWRKPRRRARTFQQCERAGARVLRWWHPRTRASFRFGAPPRKLIQRIGVILQFVDLPVAAEGAAPALGGGGGVKVGEQEGGAAHQDACEFPHGADRIAEVAESQGTEHEVGRRTGDGKRGGIGCREPPAQSRLSGRDIEHGGRQVHTDGRQACGPAAGAAPYVDGAARTKGVRSTAAGRAAPARRSAKALRPRYRPKARSPCAPIRGSRTSEALQARLPQTHQLLRQAQFARENRRRRWRSANC